MTDCCRLQAGLEMYTEALQLAADDPERAMRAHGNMARRPAPEPASQ